ncbi:MAG: hypothetical protein ABII09_00740 [Planctomycetota bacterium]
MKTKKAIFYLLAGVLAGCVPVMSLHPLYDNQTLVFDEKLLGTFEADGVTWEFTRAKDPNAYELIYTAVSKDDPNILKGLFEVRLVNLDNRLFLDIFPKKGPWGDEEELNRTTWPLNAFLMIPVHTFAKVKISESQLRIQLTDDEKFKEIVKSVPNAVKHESVNGTPVLTGSTPQLQSFVLKFADDDRLFPNENILTRKTSEPVQDANQTKTPGPDANELPV